MPIDYLLLRTLGHPPQSCHQTSLAISQELFPSLIVCVISYSVSINLIAIILVLSLFARLANITGIDPTRMQRHRRASSSSSQSSKSERDFFRSRSSSSMGVRRSSSLILPPAMINGGTDSARNSISAIESLQRLGANVNF